MKEYTRTEITTGIFILIGILLFGWIAISVGNLRLPGSERYILTAKFTSVAGLKKGSVVEIAGVRVGTVQKVSLEKGLAVVRMALDSSLRLEDDSLASVRTKGLIGEKYIKITPGSSEDFLESGDEISETEPSVDIEDLIGKFMSNDDSSEK